MKIKEAGYKGLLYANNSKGVLVAARDGVRGEHYTCPLCGCTMYFITSRNGKPYFARNPGSVHSDARCATQESNPYQGSFAGCTPFDLMTRLTHNSNRRGPVPGPDGGSGPEPDNDPDPEPDPNLDNDIQEVPFSSLKQIYNYGIYSFHPDAVQGKYKVSDFILTFKYARKLFKDPLFELGPRIVHVRFHSIIAENNTIVFRMYEGDFSVLFLLVFPQKRLEDYKMIMAYFRTPLLVKGKTIPDKDRIDSDVLIASENWGCLSRKQISTLKEKYSWIPKSNFAFTTNYTSPNQIYIHGMTKPKRKRH